MQRKFDPMPPQCHGLKETKVRKNGECNKSAKKNECRRIALRRTEKDEVNPKSDEKGAGAQGWKGLFKGQRDNGL